MEYGHLYPTRKYRSVGEVLTPQTLSRLHSVPFMPPVPEACIEHPRRPESLSRGTQSAASEGRMIAAAIWTYQIHFIEWDTLSNILAGYGVNVDRNNIKRAAY